MQPISYYFFESQFPTPNMDSTAIVALNRGHILKLIQVDLHNKVQFCRNHLFRFVK